MSAATSLHRLGHQVGLLLAAHPLWMQILNAGGAIALAVVHDRVDSRRLALEPSL